MDNDFNLTAADSLAEMDYFDTHEAFIDKFGHGVPTEMLPSHISEEQIMAAMKQCLEEGEDRLLEILHVEINDQLIY